MNRKKNLEVCLVISTGLILLWLIYEVKALLIIAFFIGIAGLFLNSIATGITWFWYKIADLLGFIVPKILLTFVFFIFLFPIALIYRLFSRNDLLQLKKSAVESYWIERNHKYNLKDLEQMW